MDGTSTVTPESLEPNVSDHQEIAITGQEAGSETDYTLDKKRKRDDENSETEPKKLKSDSQESSTIQVNETSTINENEQDTIKKTEEVTDQEPAEESFLLKPQEQHQEVPVNHTAEQTPDTIAQYGQYPQNSHYHPDTHYHQEQSQYMHDNTYVGETHYSEEHHEHPDQQEHQEQTDNTENPDHTDYQENQTNPSGQTVEIGTVASELQKAFWYFDVCQAGYLRDIDLAKLIHCLGFQLSKNQAEDLIRKAWGTIQPRLFYGS